MANPQCENGYTKLSNEIIEALSKTRINGEAWQVLLVILRKTYGFHKRQDKISLSQFVLSTSIKRPNVCRAINKLLFMNIIIQIDKENITIYQFNKDFDTWKPLSKKITQGKVLSKKIMPIIEKDNESLSKKIHTKDNIKETITKDISERSSQGNLINKIIKEFEPINPSYEKIYKNRTQRAALERMLKKYGYDKLSGMIKYLPIINSDKYARGKSINPLQLEDNLGLIVAHYNQNKTKSALLKI